MSTLTLQPDATAGLDTYLDSFSAGANAGTNSAVQVGRFGGVHPASRRALLQFDLSSIAAGQAISAATLTLVATSAPGSALAGHSYRLTQAAWTEAGATWNTYDGTNAWASAGGDWDAASGIAFTIPTSGAITLDVTALASDAYTARSGILRLVLKADDETTVNVAALNSSDAATAGNRPQLVVTYAAAAASAYKRSPLAPRLIQGSPLGG